jgi:hypothetical protein
MSYFYFVSRLPSRAVSQNISGIHFSLHFEHDFVRRIALNVSIFGITHPFSESVAHCLYISRLMLYLQFAPQIMRNAPVRQNLISMS